MKVALILMCLTLATPRFAEGQLGPYVHGAGPAAAATDSATSAGDAFLTGAVAGFVAGGVLGAIVASDGTDAGGYNRFFGLVGGALLGALAGGMIGLVIYNRR